MEGFSGLTDEEWNLIESYFLFNWGIQHKGVAPIPPTEPNEYDFMGS